MSIQIFTHLFSNLKIQSCSFVYGSKETNKLAYLSLL